MPFRGRLAEPPIDFALMNPSRSARLRALSHATKRGSTSLAIFGICFAHKKNFCYTKNVFNLWQSSFLMAVLANSRRLGLNTLGRPFKFPQFL
jgi:hypothetical protein